MPISRRRRLALSGLWLVIVVAVGGVLLGACGQPTGAEIDDPATDSPESDPPSDTPEPESIEQIISVDFDAASAGYAASDFAATGFALEPEPGALNAQAWQITGFSDGDLAFGDEAIAGDFARGASPGGVSTGGIYAFEVAQDNTALGFQPTTSDFAPGSVTMRVPVTVSNVKSMKLSFGLWVRNDEDRATAWRVSSSVDGQNWHDFNDPVILTPEGADAAPEWLRIQCTFLRYFDIDKPNAGDIVYLRWNAEDSSGTGGRDEVALDDIRLYLTGTE